MLGCDPATYSPLLASELACARARSAFCAASTFSFFPSHALRAEDWLELLNDDPGPGVVDLVDGVEEDARSCSESPPLRKVMPGTEVGWTA